MTVDLLCLVADKNMQAAISGLLARPESLGIRAIECRLETHPRRDPGCFHEGAEFLRGQRWEAEHAMVVLDHAWAGVPADSASSLEDLLEGRLGRAGIEGWAKAVVIEPELEAWVFSESVHVVRALGWTDRSPGLRQALSSESLWPDDCHKPPDPKAAMEWALRRARVPRSSSIYGDLASTVSTRNCTDRAFVRFRGLLQDWFPA